MQKMATLIYNFIKKNEKDSIFQKYFTFEFLLFFLWTSSESLLTSSKSFPLLLVPDFLFGDFFFDFGWRLVFDDFDLLGSCELDRRARWRRKTNSIYRVTFMKLKIFFNKFKNVILNCQKLWIEPVAAGYGAFSLPVISCHSQIKLRLLKAFRTRGDARKRSPMTTKFKF